MRGKGEGSIFKDTATGLWTAIIELPPRDGKRRRKTIRRKLKADVLDELNAVKAEFKKRGDLPTKGETVEQWFGYWLREIVAKERRPNTLDQYKHSSVHILAAIGKVRLDSLTAVHMRRVHSHMTDTKKLSSTTTRLAHATMARSFKVAVQEGRMGRNPATLVNAPPRAIAPQEAFEVDEAVRVLEHVSRDPLMGARWATALLTGARRGEVIGLERDRVTDRLDLSWQLQRIRLSEVDGKPDVPADFEYRHLTGGLYLTRPKSSAGWRIIPLVPPLKGILERYMNTQPENEWGLLFALNGRPIDPRQDSANWLKVRAETKIERDVVLHGLRHTAVDLLYMAGVPEDLIMEIVGQSTRSTTRSYKSRGKVHELRMQTALEQMSALFTLTIPETTAAIEP